MIYAKDIQHLIEPAKWQVTPQKNLMHYDELIQNVQAQTKQKITFFYARTSAKRSMAISVSQ